MPSTSAPSGSRPLSSSTLSGSAEAKSKASAIRAASSWSGVSAASDTILIAATLTRFSISGLHGPVSFRRRADPERREWLILPQAQLPFPHHFEGCRQGRRQNGRPHGGFDHVAQEVTVQGYPIAEGSDE